MNIFSKLFPENLYHSYIVEGDPDVILLSLLDFLESRIDVGIHNPDILSQNYESFSIADSYEIKEWHSKRGITDNKRICIIGAKFINREAEQALLKMIEEPQSGTHFFIVVPNASILLDTLRSRTHIIKVEPDESEFSTKAQEFIKAPIAKRIEIVAQLLDDNKDNDTSGKLRFEATELINELEKNMFQKFKKDKNDINIQFVLNELSSSRMYLGTPGASVKMILEHIALVL